MPTPGWAGGTTCAGAAPRALAPVDAGVAGNAVEVAVDAAEVGVDAVEVAVVEESAAVWSAEITTPPFALWFAVNAAGSGAWMPASACWTLPD